MKPMLGREKEIVEEVPDTNLILNYCIPREKKVIIVDADSSSREIISRVLAKDGAQVFEFSSYSDALSRFNSEDKIDLVVLDIPNINENYIKYIETLKFRHPFCSIIITTSFLTQEGLMAMIKAGITDVVQKPFENIEHLYDILKKGIAKSKAMLKIALSLPEINRYREEIVNLKREIESLKKQMEDQENAFEESQEVFYLDLSRMMTIIDNIVDGIVFTDRDARITLINPVAEKYLGVKSFVAIGQRLDEIDGRGELLNIVSEDQIRVLEEDAVSRTVEIHDSDKDISYLKITTTAVTDYRGNFAGLLTVIQDITSEFKADQLKNQYLSIVSHELRTPLTGIKTFIRMMGKGALGPVNESQSRVLETMKEHTLRLEHQIDKLITLGMLDREDFAKDFEVFPITEIINASVAPFEQEAEDKSIELRVSLPKNADKIYINADKQNIKRVLQILIENAIKFNKKGGEVELKVIAGPEEVLFRISDTGIGIDPKYHKRIFEKFFQVEDPLTRQYGGAGLGLTVAERILRSHRTSMVLESSLGAGATFQFSLKRFKKEEEGFS